MIIGILGGGGVRSPIILRMISEYKFKEPVDEVRIYDIDQKKTNAILKLARAILNRQNRRLNMLQCNSIEEFARGLDAVIFTIREGFEEARAIDERICLNHHIIGQETTGAAGFAFAARSVPALIKYAMEIKRQSPNCILINFTNPAGIVVRALNIAGIVDVIGICDSSDAARIHAAELMGCSRFDFDIEIAGLNHLSWTTRLIHKGRDILQDILYRDDFYEIAHGPFEREIFTKNGLFKNEYLYYYYCTEKALTGMLEERETRGEYLKRKNADLIESLIREESEEKLIQIYESYLNDRFQTYMSYAYKDIKRRVAENESEGYAEIALRIISAIKDRQDLNIPMVLPNRGVVPFLSDEIVVEKFCTIKGGNITSDPIKTPLPDYEENLIRNIALYENLAAYAIVNRSYAQSIEALSVHPLIGKGIAEKVLKDFVRAHREYFEGYR
jgi:6-phospho-beta-glucosidase